ncbi:MAG TPA: lytic transglycosylase domain-containing protein [Allosphingosinicella sp.]|uniref:lytic transglycosylase domain-containing protein n=1 Tax=Allosphingosinicella sp. TaxID=2823234 RepID=UPI002ED77662
MHKKAILLGLLAASVAGVAATTPSVKRLEPAALATGGTSVAAQVVTAAPAAPVVQQPQYPVSGSIASAVTRWKSLRQTDGLPFVSYSSFLTSYRGWPGEESMRRSAERAINAGTLARDIVSYFNVHPPLTAKGQAAYAVALNGTGQPNEARSQAKLAWAKGAMPREDEDRLLALFGASLTPQDHERRMDALLDNGDLQSAQRTLSFIATPRRALYDARIALQTRAPDAMSRVSALGAGANSDAGLVMDRANWLRSTSQPAAARALLAQPKTLTTRPANVEKYYEALLAMAKGAANDRQWGTVYGITSQIDQAYAPGTDVSLQSYGERDEYTSLAWLGGTTAFYQLGRPADAVTMFDRYGRGSRSPQTRAKGFYWAGRAAQQAGQSARANSFFSQAAAYPDQFYGQLALERLGRPVPPPVAQPAASPAVRASFEQRPLVQATRLLGQLGQHQDQSVFIRQLGEELKTDEERALAAELGLRIGRPDLGVWAARGARTSGASFYTRGAFPQVSIPPAYTHQWTLNHAIMRQESSFDRAAMSQVGARGMMQLMPGTARETAGKLGLSYDLSRLTGDPQYNIMLGSKYFADLMNRYGNYAPLAVAAYNAGPGNVNKWLRENGDPRTPGVDVIRWIEEIPFFETKNYVQRVLENAVAYDAMNPARARSPQNMRLSYYLGKRSPG